MAGLSILDILGLIVLIGGLFFYVMGTIGLIRFKDLYVRIHSGGLISTLGIYGFIIAAMLLNPSMVWKLIVLGLLMFLVQPVSSQVIAQAAYQANLKPFDTVRDDLDGNIKTHGDQVQDLTARDE